MKQSIILGNFITMDEKCPFAKAALVKMRTYAYMLAHLHFVTDEDIRRMGATGRSGGCTTLDGEEVYKA